MTWSPDDGPYDDQPTGYSLAVRLVCWWLLAMLAAAAAAMVLTAITGCTWTHFPDGTTHKTFGTRTSIATSASVAVVSDSDRAVDRAATMAERTPDAVMALYKQGVNTTPRD